MAALSKLERRLWEEEVPVLARFVLEPDGREDYGKFVRATRFGDLYLETKDDKNYYTLVTREAKRIR